MSDISAPLTIELEDPDYPTALRDLPQPPPTLYIRGCLELLERPAIAVIGTRAHSVYGRDAAVSFVVGLVRAGYVIVSGLARGIDAIAHRTALDVGGHTVAVLGTGLDVAYPAEHEDLARAVAERGCLVTEFPAGTPPRKYHFPQRNRIIAGLSRAVLVVEAAERSGTLITANYALEEGKEIFAVPGPIHNATSRGCHRLIQDGAALATSVADILQVLQSRTGEPLPAPLAAGIDPEVLAGQLQQESEPEASALAQRVWARLGEGAVELEALGASLAAAPAPLAAALVELELAGLVQKLPGPRYVRAQAIRPLIVDSPD